MKTFESSLDKPKAGLDGAVWTEDWPPYLTSQAEAVVQQIIAFAKETFKLPPFKLHIVGSITSNQWTDTSDIDLHFCCPSFKAEQADAFNKLFKDWFKNVYIAAGNPAYIAQHPIEIYMQPNEVQDYMSIGCYDVLEKRWEVGPELLPLDYNPIATWWNVDMQKVDSIVHNMRDVILRCYETAKALKEVYPGNDVFDQIAQMLANYVSEAAQLLKAAKEERKHGSEPKTKEEALALRNSEEWKINDTAFKLLDKYGYLAILKKCQELVDKFQEDDSDKQAAAAELLCAIQSNLSPTKYLSEQLQKISERIESTIQWQNASILDESISNEDDYIKNFKDKFGYQDDYVCKDNVGDVAQKIAKECALRMPYDTEAREIEGDAVMLLVSSGNKEAIDAGKALGDFMLATDGKEHDEEQLLKLMSDAYKKLTELEHKEETDESEQQVDEGAKEWLSLAAICGMLAIPGLMPNDALAAQMKKVPKQEMKINSPAMKNAMKKATTDNKSYNGMNATNVVNAVARTIYAEAKAEGTEGLDAVASVIWNRAGGNADNFISIVSKKSKKTNKCQFSCWNKYTGGWKDADYKYSIPSLKELANATSKAAWDHSIELAKKMLAGTFKSTIGNRNSYMNKDTADKVNVDTWGKDLDLKIGKHHFGYFSYNDGFKTKGSKTTPQQKIYVVKDGDTLWKIAKANGTTVDDLKAKNQLDNPDKLKIGQKLRV